MLFHIYTAACGKSRHRASLALWVATLRMMMVMMVMMMTTKINMMLKMTIGRTRSRMSRAMTMMGGEVDQQEEVEDDHSRPPPQLPCAAAKGCFRRGPVREER